LEREYEQRLKRAKSREHRQGQGRERVPVEISATMRTTGRGAYKTRSAESPSKMVGGSVVKKFLSRVLRVSYRRKGRVFVCVFVVAYVGKDIKKRERGKRGGGNEGTEGAHTGLQAR
jgi:hypothetical protein